MARLKVYKACSSPKLAGCERIGSWCRLRKLGCSGIYVEYDRFGVLVKTIFFFSVSAPRIIRKR